MAKTWTSKERSTAPQVSISTEEAQKGGCSNSLVGEEMQAARTHLPTMHPPEAGTSEREQCGWCWECQKKLGTE